MNSIRDAELLHLDKSEDSVANRGQSVTSTIRLIEDNDEDKQRSNTGAAETPPLLSVG